MEDFRVDRTKTHPLLNILVIALCGVLCGANSWTEIEVFGNAKRAWFAKFLALEGGIPSHDTFGRVFGMLDPEQFEHCFTSWMQAVAQLTEAEVVAVDGKCLRGSHDRRLGKNAIYMVSAWASQNRLVLGQTKVDQKSNEITAVPALLRVLDLAGCMVTLDAMGCQKEIATQLVEEKEADYVLALKGNQGNLYNAVQTLFADAETLQFENLAHDFHKTVDKGHGRLEIRRCWTLPKATWAPYVPEAQAWTGLETLVMVRTERRQGAKVEENTRYFISSLGSQAAQMLQAVRSHWTIENALHWVLDVTFREDDSRVRQAHRAQNFSILRHLALNLLKQERTDRRGLQSKRLRAGWDAAYLERILRGFAG